MLGDEQPDHNSPWVSAAQPVTCQGERWSAEVPLLMLLQRVFARVHICTEIIYGF